MRLFSKLIVTGVVAFAILQVVRPGIPSKPATAELQVPPNVRRILEKDCYSCHSDQRRLSWFDQIVPGYWLVRHDILTAREHLNFSSIGSKPAAAQRATLYEAVNMIQLGAMPLSQFLMLHPEANVTPEELATLKDYLAPWTPALTYSGNLPTSSSETAAAVSLATVQPALNGLPFDPSFESWKPISTTDRGDNNTFRFILGNDIAVKAAQSGNISPWPYNTRFAKIAWQQELGSDGLVHPGKFIQVELMVKDAQRYKDTDGWGWGRWRGVDLKPYGESAHFVNECIGCHRPVRGNDYVYTLPITAAKFSREEVVNNSAAALPFGMPYQPLSWSAITMYVDPSTHTTATLYGNDIAMQGVRAPGMTQSQEPSSQAYPTGAVLALVTWVQRDDPHWFGARIPASPQSVEFVQVAAAAETGSYRRFAGNGLAEDHAAAATAAQRMSFILGLSPAQLPKGSYPLTALRTANIKENTVMLNSNRGIIDIPSNHSVDQTVEKLKAILQAKGITLFALVDHSGEAEKIGLKMLPTKLVIFGNPKAGTPLMLAAPSVAIDLPLKILIWQDSSGKTWISYDSTAYLQKRHGLPEELLQNIAVVETLAAKAAE